MKKHLIIPMLLIAPLGISASYPANQQYNKPQEQKSTKLWNNRKQFPSNQSAQQQQQVSPKSNYKKTQSYNNRRSNRRQVAANTNNNYQYNRSTRMLTEANNQFNNQTFGDHYVTNGDLNILHYIRDNLRSQQIVSNPDSYDFIIDRGRVTIVGDFKNPTEEQTIVEFVQSIDGVKDVATHTVSDKQMPMDSRNKMDKQMDMEKQKMEEMQNAPGYSKRLGQNFRRPLIARIEGDESSMPMQNGMMNTNDQALKDKIVDALQNTWVRKSFKNVDVKVEDGVVILEGTLDSEKDISEIRNRIKNINGIQEVVESFNIRTKQ